MRKLYLVNLTVEERAVLTQLVKRDRVSGLKRLRAGILLKADEGLTDQEIADDLEAGLVTVERVRSAAASGVSKRPSSASPKTIPPVRESSMGHRRRSWSRLPAVRPPKGRARWTISLLADRLVELSVFESVSKSTIQRGLKKTTSSLGR